MTRGLPKRLHFKHGAYYYVASGKWLKLSRDYPEALREYSLLVSGVGVGMEALLDRYLARQKTAIAASTHTKYSNAAKRLKTVFAEFSPELVKPHHVYAVRNQFTDKPAWANQLLAVLKGAFQLAIEEGTIDTNPVREVKNLRELHRKRYITDEEFKSIRGFANPSMQSIMDVAYQTGQRISDVLGIRLSDISENGIYFKQAKTGTMLTVGWSAELRQAIAEAKRIHGSVKGFTLFHKRDGSPYAYRTVHDFWDRARIKAGLKDCRIHDLRAKAGTDASKQGQDSKSLLGHKSDSSHSVYLRDPDIPIVEPVRVRK